MDPTTLTQGAIEVAKAAALSVPFTAIVNRVLGPAADEYAEQLRDKRRLYRFEKELAGWRKATKMIADAGFQPTRVPPKVLFPLLEGMGLEENEDLHTMWAALLANAANLETPDLVHPSFARTLRQLTSEDAMVIHDLFIEFTHLIKEANGRNPIASDFLQFLRPYNTGIDFPEGAEAYAVTAPFGPLGHLEASYLVERQHAPMIGLEVRPSLVYYRLTPRGYEFVKACQPPNPKN